MVIARLCNAIRHDLSRFAQQTRSFVQRESPWLRPGLYTYRFATNGCTSRVHLRVDGDAAGVLYIDVSEVVHLSPTATLIAKLILDGEDADAVSFRLYRRFRDVSRKQFSRECRQIAEMIALLTNQDKTQTPSLHHCRACTLMQQSLATMRSFMFHSSLTAPFKADIALTYGCNNRCSHCYNERRRVKLQSLSLEEWKVVINRLVAIGVPHIILTGGEPTLHPDLLDIIHHADDSGPVVGLNTNGRRLSDLSFTQELEASGLNHVQITLESCRPDVHNSMVGEDAWEESVNAIKNSLQTRMHTITNTTLTRHNADHVEETIQFLHALGLRTFAMNGMIHSGGGRAHPDAIPEKELTPILVCVRDKAEKLEMQFLWYTPTEYCRMSPVELEIGAKRCNAAEYSICIEPDGEVLPCQSYYVSAGNILHDSWDQIWNSELFRCFRDRFQHPEECGLPQKCWDCPDLHVCGGGCRIEREAHQQITIRAGHAREDTSLCANTPGQSIQGCREGEMQDVGYNFTPR